MKTLFYWSVTVSIICYIKIFHYFLTNKERNIYLDGLYDTLLFANILLDSMLIIVYQECIK